MDRCHSVRPPGLKEAGRAGWILEVGRPIEPDANFTDMPFSSPRLGYTILVCDDLSAMRAFYVNTLCLPVVEERDDFIKLDAQTVFIALRHGTRNYDDRTGHGTTQLAFSVTVDEVDAWHHRLDEAGVRILETPTDQQWGHRTLFAADPEGNLVEFYALIG